ncbi:hypothetical protein KKA95_01295 [Patescibacteria group bacterium]|nr:hypothetical protein [Patescibacteria group bacterium]
MLSKQLTFIDRNPEGPLQWGGERYKAVSPAFDLNLMGSEGYERATELVVQSLEEMIRGEREGRLCITFDGVKVPEGSIGQPTLKDMYPSNPETLLKIVRKTIERSRQRVAETTGDQNIKA